MDIQSFAGLRDRRVAASDEYIATRGDNSRIYRGNANMPGGVQALRHARGGAPGWDRSATDIHTIVLHQTAGRTFLAPSYLGALRDRPGGGSVSDRSELDRVAAHFVVRNDGVVFYTHDIQYVIDSAGGRYGIDIEFAGDYGRHGIRLTPDAIRVARKLIRSLKGSVPTITNIHPHGQVQTVDFDRVGPSDPRTGQRARVRRECGGPGHANLCSKYNSCPGADVWVNVGVWASRAAPDGGLGLVSATPRSPYPNNTISTALTDPAFAQGV